VVLDATEGGERTLPGRFDPERTRRDPVEELVDAYFGTIPDVFRRPNDRLYQWLGAQMAARGVRGILFRRYLGCDLWHAELYRLRQWSPVPVLDFDAVGEDDSAANRTVGRLEAFLEMLQ
jgi:benzoyl-CoA reductase/2-hydroxyglutaryl-CoA dehydratase subunit BcrC/BadD/HgdB